MSLPPPDSPALTERAIAAQQARREREAVALRENLRRRKLQQRARDTEPEPPNDTDPPAGLP